MQRTVITVADATRARVFVFEGGDSGGRMRESLTELRDLVNLQGHQRDAEFATSIAHAVAKVAGDTGARRVIVCASPHLLGLLRTTDLESHGLVVDELAREYAHLSPPEIRATLVDHGLLIPPPPRPGQEAQA